MNNTQTLQQQQIEKWKLWKTLEGNGILDTNELRCKMVANLLCLQCVMEKVSGIASLVQISDATLEIKVKKAAFACILSVRCKRGHPLFTLEPSHAPINDNNDRSNHHNFVEHINNDVVGATNRNDSTDANDRSNHHNIAERINNDVAGATNWNESADANDHSNHHNVVDNNRKETAEINHHGNHGNIANASNGNNNRETINEALDGCAVQQNNKKRKGRPKSTERIQDYCINYQAYMLMQLFGNGVTGLDTLLGMLGLGVHSGSRRSWAIVMSHCGKAQQAVADAVQKTNLQNEINAMKGKGIQPVMENG